jgi:RNA polymerase sigma factor for flagellar operon FliA
MMTVASEQHQKLIEECQGLVRSLALRIHRKVPPNIELDDLISYGQVGLSEAARDFDPARGNQFSTFAYYRIRGAIYDGLAKMSWFGRHPQRPLRYEQMADSCLAVDSEETPDPARTTAADDARWLRDLSRTLAVVYLTATYAGHGQADTAGAEGGLVDRSSPEASASLFASELRQRLDASIAQLAPAAGQLIRAVYFEETTLEEAGVRIGVSKSWASRLHARALQQLARSLRLEEFAV